MGCNPHQKAIIAPESKKEFTYTSPLGLIRAMQNMNGFEDSHSVPNHESLMHEHATIESWTTKAAIEGLRSEGEKYAGANSHFEAMVSGCDIPDYDVHTYNAGANRVDHYLLSSPMPEALKLAAETLKKKGHIFALIFKDRIIYWMVDGTLKVVPREKPSSP